MQDDSRIRLQLRRRKAAATSRVVAVAEVEAAHQARLEARVRVGLHATDGEMTTIGNDYYRGGLGCNCVAVTRAASSGDGLRGYAEEEQRVMAAGAAAGCSGRGEKEAEGAATAVEVAGKRRRHQPTMGGNGGWRPELAAAMVKKAGSWLRLRVDCDSGWGAAR
ncbi:hypothetical protein BHE74_00043760 [Ensete ventricosum]|nr:hypothetical protein BHE74_00043760 [Ensete ventricosum]